MFTWTLRASFCSSSLYNEVKEASKFLYAAEFRSKIDACCLMRCAEAPPCRGQIRAPQSVKHKIIKFLRGSEPNRYHRMLLQKLHRYCPLVPEKSVSHSQQGRPKKLKSPLQYQPFVVNYSIAMKKKLTQTSASRNLDLMEVFVLKKDFRRSRRG